MTMYAAPGAFQQTSSGGFGEAFASMIFSLLAGLVFVVPLVAWWLIRRPIRAIWLAMLVVAVVYHEQYPFLPWVVVGLLVATLITWATAWPRSFRRRVWWPTRGRFRAMAVYNPRWRKTLEALALDERDHQTGDRFLPRRYPVTSSTAADHFRVRMLPGQTLEAWMEHTEELATAFNATECRIRPAAPWRFHRHPRRIYLDVVMLRHDALAEIVEQIEPAGTPALHALPVARTEDGDVYLLNLLGQHVLVGGATGAGKGSVLWSIVCQLAPGVQSGLVKLYGLDPKSLEFPYGAGLFSDVIDGEPERMAAALEGLVAVMNRRKAKMRGLSRLHTPTVEEPFIVVVVDELAALTGYVTVPTVKRRIENGLNLLLTQGRAMAISVIAAAQDPRKEALGNRGLFTVRIGMRLNERGDVDLLLGAGSRDRGALCDRIRHDTPGVAYVLRDGDAVASRVRFPWVSDDAIREYAARYGSGVARSLDDELAELLSGGTSSSQDGEAS